MPPVVDVPPPYDSDARRPTPTYSNVVRSDHEPLVPSRVWIFERRPSRSSIESEAPYWNDRERVPLGPGPGWTGYLTVRGRMCPGTPFSASVCSYSHV